MHDDAIASGKLRNNFFRSVLAIGSAAESGEIQV